MTKGHLIGWTLLVVLMGAMGGWYAAHHLPHEHALVQVTDAQGKVYWTCPMHPQVRQAKPGTCPICGMPLVSHTELQPAASQPATARQILYWYDPMKPDQHFDKPGKSPYMDMELVPKYAATDAAGSSVPAPTSEARRVLYWYDPMKPDQHFDKPGKSPYMDMELVPKYAEPGGGGASAGTVVAIDPRMAQNLGMRTAVVREAALASRLEVTGTVAIDETRQYVVEARAAGWVERLDVRAVGESVRAGQTVAALYAPEMRAAQEELGVALRLQDKTLIQAAQSRLRLLGVSDVARSSPQVPVTATHGGVVTEIGVRQGAQVTPGVALLKLADLARVWVVIEVPEARAADLAIGARVAATFQGLPGQAFSGTVDFIYPVIDGATRTVRARLSFANPEGTLKPGMYASVTLRGSSTRSVMLVPSEALIATGTRSTVLVAEGEGRYRPVSVSVGPEQGDETVILGGLQAGQKIVVSGQFLLDSEANLLGAYERMGAAQDQAQSPAAMTRNMGASPAPGAYEIHPDQGEQQ